MRGTAHAACLRRRATSAEGHTMRVSALGHRPWRCAGTRWRPAYVRTVNTAAMSAERARPPPYDTLFCGTDHFACVALQALLERPELHRSLHVLTPPDVKHAWGAKRMRVSPVKQLAEAQGLPTLQVPPTGLDDLVLPDEMAGSSAPLLLTASFGHRIPSSLLQQFPNASHTLNLHPSMLPELRGAAPLQWAIARQYSRTGLTVQQLHPTDFDHGGILKQVEVPVPPGITYPELEAQLARRGAQLLVDVVASLPDYSAHVVPQEAQHATRAPKLQPKFSVVRWARWDAKTCDARMRAFGYMVRGCTYISNLLLRRSCPHHTRAFRLYSAPFWRGIYCPAMPRTMAPHSRRGKARSWRAGAHWPCRLSTVCTLSRTCKHRANHGARPRSGGEAFETAPMRTAACSSPRYGAVGAEGCRRRAARRCPWPRPPAPELAAPRGPEHRPVSPGPGGARQSPRR